MVEASMFIQTNNIDIQLYRTRFEAIYAEYSADWVNLRTQHPEHRVEPIVILGERRGTWKDSAEYTVFLDYIASVARDTHIIPYSMSTAVVLEDAVEGYRAHMLMDQLAKSQLDELHHTFFSGPLRHEFYLEDEIFTAGASLLWVRTLEEATAIVNDINKLSVHITGQIETLIVSGLRLERRFSPKIILDGQVNPLPFSDLRGVGQPQYIKSQVFEQFKLVSH